MSTKFGLIIDFDLLKAAISTNAKPEIVLLRFGRHIALSRWRLQPLNTISGFALVDVAAFRRSKSMSKLNFVDISQLMAKITTSVFAQQTSAILQIYFRFRFRPFARNLHIILHQATEFCPNRSTHCENMTSYPFLNMAAATAKYYFRFRICCVNILGCSVTFYEYKNVFLMLVD